jgi:hypothetical protein
MDMEIYRLFRHVWFMSPALYLPLFNSMFFGEITSKFKVLRYSLLNSCNEAIYKVKYDKFC